MYVPCSQSCGLNWHRGLNPNELDLSSTYNHIDGSFNPVNPSPVVIVLPVCADIKALILERKCFLLPTKSDSDDISRLSRVNRFIDARRRKNLFEVPFFTVPVDARWG